MLFVNSIMQRCSLANFWLVHSTLIFLAILISLIL
uniref:Uncharacterized protein n=1 Tax=Lepeophtheirus salmonis TaxID=72036 RepID=A0A0K2T4L5_LEPSM